MQTTQETNTSHSNISLKRDEHGNFIKPKTIYIGDDNWKPFVRKTAIAMLVSAFFFLTWITVYLIDEKLFKTIFKGYSRNLNGFDIGSYITLFLSFLIPSVFPGLCRRYWWPFVISIGVCLIYTPSFLIRLSIKERFNFSEFLITGYTVYVCVVIGFAYNAFTAKDKFKPDTGIIISVSLFITVLILFVYVINMYNPKKGYLAAVVLSCYLAALYLNHDMCSILKKRTDFYLEHDWFLGYIHTHTDIFFRFWADFFKEDSVVVQNFVIVTHRKGGFRESNLDMTEIEEEQAEDKLEELKKTLE